MENDNTNTESQNNATVTPSASSEGTQSTETQSAGSVEASNVDNKVTSDLGIKEKQAEPEKSAPQMSIDDIVAEAMSGEISEETQKIIDENGLGKHLDMLVQGHRAIQEKNNQEIYKMVGGDKAYSELQEWGVNNLSKQEQEAFNKALFSGNMDLAKLAVQGLNARYISAVGKSPERLIESGSTANAANRPFSNVQEYLKEARTTKYKRDPEYRKQVEQKRNASGF